MRRPVTSAPPLREKDVNDKISRVNFLTEYGDDCVTMNQRSHDRNQEGPLLKLEGQAEFLAAIDAADSNKAALDLEAEDASYAGSPQY